MAQLLRIILVLISLSAVQCTGKTFVRLVSPLVFYSSSSSCSWTGRVNQHSSSLSLSSGRELIKLLSNRGNCLSVGGPTTTGYISSTPQGNPPPPRLLLSYVSWTTLIKIHYHQWLSLLKCGIYWPALFRVWHCLPASVIYPCHTLAIRRRRSLNCGGPTNEAVSAKKLQHLDCRKVIIKWNEFTR